MTADPHEPEVVYHYTTMDTMIKIVESKAIWATSIDYLNDTSEGKHYLGLVRRRLQEFAKEYDGLLKGFTDATKDDTFESRHFVASFSSEDDALPQLRAYCSNGNGVAIGFSVDCLKRAHIAAYRDTWKDAVGFFRVDYLPETVPSSVIEAEISRAIKATDDLQSSMRRHLPKFKSTREIVFRSIIERQACSKKHSSFSNECEYRLVVDPIYVDPSCLNFRPTRTTLVPYVAPSIPETLRF